MNAPEIVSLFPGEYTVISEISGENSELFVVYDKVCTRKMIVKSGDTELIENEARTLSRLYGKGIPVLYGAFEYKGKGYSLRQYIEGKTLRKYMRDDDFGIREAARIISELCGIISILHAADPPVIHRDIKAENIIVTPQGRVYMIDFGISRLYDDKAARDTRVMGTLSSAPPEQFGYGQTDMRSDIYSIGVLLREMVEACGGRIPKRISSVIKKCTMFSPEDRYSDVDEVRRAVGAYGKNTVGRSRKLSRVVPIVCAAVLLVFAIAVSLSVSREKSEHISHVEIDSEYRGDYILTNNIPKSVLEQYDGDISVSLEIEVGVRHDWANLAVIAPTWENSGGITLKEQISCEYPVNSDGFMTMEMGDERCEFILSRKAVDKLGDEGICFQPTNITVRSATLKPAN